MKRLKPYLDRDLADLDGEIWESVVGYDGYYEVSNLGRVKSLKRLTSRGYYTKEKILKQMFQQSLRVVFSVDNRPQKFMVSNIVGQSFIREKKEDEYYTIKNYDKTDCSVNNIGILKISTFKKKLFIDNKIKKPNSPSKLNKENLLKHIGIYENGELIAKICVSCFQEKSLDLYRNGYNKCKECVYISRGIVDIGKKERDNLLKKSGLKKCPNCQVTKNINEFSPQTSICRSCNCEKKKERYKQKKLLA